MEELGIFTIITGPIEYTTVAITTFLPQPIKRHYLWFVKLQKYSNFHVKLQLRKKGVSK